AGLADSLSSCFPTWGEAVQGLNSVYRGNCWWFGKWHLSNCTTETPLSAYGFNTRTYPGGTSKNPSPNGLPNEGTNGGLFGSSTYASDSQISGDFIQWLQSQSSGTPWCATVSLINPHDIADAPAWLQNTPFPPTGVPKLPAYF